MPLATVSLTRQTRGKQGYRSQNTRIAAIEAQLQAMQPLVIPTYTVSGLPAAAAGNAGVIVRVSNGAAGSPCLAMSNATNWLQIALGAAVSAT